MLFLLSMYFGLGGFFSFFVAPTLFKVLEREQASAVVERVFPYYFWIGLAVVAVSLLIALTSKMPKFLNMLLMVNLMVLIALVFYVSPKVHDLKVAGSPEFLKMHLVSVIMSTVSLFLTFGSIVYLIVKRNVGS